MAEPRAKRTHARRSCDLCKVRKTRCELPDLNVPSASSPLPVDKSCHRCRVLALPCVVDDSARKTRKRPREDDGSPAAASSTPRERKSARSPRRKTKTGDSNTNRNGVNHTLDVLQGFQLAREWEETQPWGNHQAPHDTFAGPAGAGLEVPVPDSNQVKSIKLHGRPLELVCAMLKVAYAKCEMKNGRSAAEELDLEALLDGDIRRRLESGYAIVSDRADSRFPHLKIFHPYLDPFSTLLGYTTSTAPDELLLISTVIYLCSLTLPAEPTITNIRNALTPFIILLRDRVLVQLPTSFHAVQALELLSIHAPLGILPLQLTDPRSIAMARGQHVALAGIATKLNFSAFFKNILRGIPRDPWDQADCWLWLCVCCLDASVALEDEGIRRPASLQDARGLVENFLDPSSEHHWRMALESIDVSEVLGRLAVCDRLARLAEVHDSLERLRQALETAAQEPLFDAVEAITEELKYSFQRIEALDQRHDVILAMISTSSRGLENAWVAFRALRRRFDGNKIHVTATRYFLATAYLPGHSLAFPGLPQQIYPHHNVTYALSRSNDPADIIPFVMHNSPAVHAVWHWGTHRGNMNEQILISFAELERIIIPNEHDVAALVPLHEAIALAVEAAKVLMEMEAGRILITRTTQAFDKAFRIPTWVYAMQQVSACLRVIGMLSPEEDGGESIANGCSNLVGSMLRMVDKWAKTLQKEEEEGSAGSTEDPASKADNNGGTVGGAGGAPGDGAAEGIAGTNGHPYDSRVPHQQYMNSSDRWMASDHSYDPRRRPVPPPSTDPNAILGANPTTHYPASKLDLLLGQMFNYNYSGPQQHAGNVVPGPTWEPAMMAGMPEHGHGDGHAHGHGHGLQAVHQE